MKNPILICLCVMTLLACNQDKKETSNDILEDIPSLETTDSLIKIDTIIKKIVVVPIEKSDKEIKEELNAKGFKTYNYINPVTQDTILMQQYFMVFLKSGPIRNQNEEEGAMLQDAHLEYLSNMYQEGYADLIGPFADDGEIRGITVYNVPTLKIADSLAHLDPLVKAGRLIVEIHPWWAPKGNGLR
ncbi:YciI family protein [Xanthomarina sp.]|uniref:YciI family protein n=1 Tax=Xanthomarina sp. TaxID=1931211 RepID=UPI002B8C3E6D|nr:YciI family protein [Xanthomarina sp.]HLV37875.1 YciI family protein [Xanthomarina sp.]